MNQCPMCGEASPLKWETGKCWSCGYCVDDDDSEELESAYREKRRAEHAEIGMDEMYYEGEDIRREHGY